MTGHALLSENTLIRNTCALSTSQYIILMALFVSESAIRYDKFSPGFVFLVQFVLSFCSDFGLHHPLREHPSLLLLNASLYSPVICSLSAFVCDIKSRVLVPNLVSTYQVNPGLC